MSFERWLNPGSVARWAAALGLALICLANSPARAQTWTPTAAGTYSWNLSTNWNPETVPNGTAVIANVNNDITGDQTINLDALIDLNVLNLGDASPTGAFAFTIAAGSGGSLRFSGPDAAINTQNGANAITAPIDLNGVALTLNVGNGPPAHDLVVSGVISSASGGSLIKAGAGTLVLSGANSYAGSTAVTAGTLVIGATNTLPVTTTLTVGGTTTAANLDLSNFSQTVAGFTAPANTTAVSTITVGSGQTLTVSNTATSSTPFVTIGAPGSATAVQTTNLTITGQGTITVNTPSAPLQIGGSTQTFGNTVTLNMANLSTFSATVSIFRVGDFTSNANAGLATVTLAATSTITANSLTVGVSGRNNGATAHQLRLGSGTNTLHVDTIIIGGSQTGATTNRSAGTLVFNTATGTLTIRARNGTGAANLSVGSAVGGTSINRTNTFDVTGHSVDLLLNNLVVGTYTTGVTANTGSFSNIFSFDTGTITASTMTIASRTGTISAGNTGAINGTVNLGGTTSTVTITGSGAAAVMIANASGSSSGTGNNPVNGTLNITGGTVTLTNGGITLANNSDTGTSGYTNTVTGTLNVSGGSLTVASAIVPGATTGPGTATSTLSLSGTGTLDMQNHGIGALTNLNFTGGTLRNPGTVGRPLTQSGGTLQRDASGTTTISGDYTLTGGTALINGTLTTPGLLSVSGTGLLTGSGTINADVAIGTTANPGGTISPGNNVGTLTLGMAGSTLMWAGGGNYLFEFAAENGTNTPGTDNDWISSAGILSVTASTTSKFRITIQPAAGYTPVGAAPQTYTIATFASAPTFNPNVFEFTINGYDGTAQIMASGNNVILQLVPVPEPAHVLLLAAGAAGLAGCWRRWRRRMGLGS